MVTAKQDASKVPPLRLNQTIEPDWLWSLNQTKLHIRSSLYHDMLSVEAPLTSQIIPDAKLCLNHHLLAISLPSNKRDQTKK